MTDKKGLKYGVIIYHTSNRAKSVYFKIIKSPIKGFDYFDTLPYDKNQSESLIKLLFLGGIHYNEMEHYYVDVFIKREQLDRYIDILRIVFKYDIDSYEEI